MRISQVLLCLALLSWSVWLSVAEGEDLGEDDPDEDYDGQVDNFDAIDGVAQFAELEEIEERQSSAGKYEHEDHEFESPNTDIEVTAETSSHIQLVITNTGTNPVYPFWVVPDGPKAGTEKPFNEIHPGESGAKLFYTLAAQTFVVRAGPAETSKVLRRIVVAASPQVQHVQLSTADGDWIDDEFDQVAPATVVDTVDFDALNKPKSTQNKVTAGTDDHVRLTITNIRTETVFVFWLVPDGPNAGTESPFNGIQPGESRLFYTLVRQTWVVRAGQTKKSERIRIIVVASSPKEQQVEVTDLDSEDNADAGFDEHVEF